MQLSNLSLRRSFPFFLFLAFANIANAQHSKHLLQDSTFQKLEAQVQGSEHLTNTRQQFEKLKVQAISASDDVSLARTLYNLMQIRDVQTTDSMYFQNSAFMDTLIESRKSSASLKAILHLMRAQRISGFDNRYNPFNSATYRRSNLKNDYASMSMTERKLLINSDFDAALQYEIKNTPIAKLSWLVPNMEMLPPEASFEDIVRSERIVWLYRTSSPDSTLAAFREWRAAHKNNPEKQAYVELLACHHRFSTSRLDSVQRQSHIKYLQNESRSIYPAVKMFALYQLAIIWNDEGNRFNAKSTDPFQRKRALQIYEQHKQDFRKYPNFNSRLEEMARQIRSAGVQVLMDDKQLPGTAMPIQVVYRNLDTIFYRIIPIARTSRMHNQLLPAKGKWLVQQAIHEGAIVLSSPEDYHQHTAELKLPALPAGSYRLIFRNKPIAAAGDSINSLAFQVTEIAAINSEKRIFILNRRTGFPLVGAKLQAFYKKTALKGWPDIIKGDGYVEIPEGRADSLSISHQGDTLAYRFSVYDNGIQPEVFDKDKYGSLNEYYTENLRMEVFTDRGIYRPGQRLHYKVIFLTKDPKSGTEILVNKEHLGAAALESWLSSHKNQHIKLKDPFGKAVDSTLIDINAFGSFAGSFVVPKAAAKGQWSIGDHSRYYAANFGAFMVEAYKRPSIELTMEKQKKMLLPGQPFSVKLKLRSFNGATLKNIPVKYNVMRSGYLLSKLDGDGRYAPEWTSVKLLDTVGYTDGQAELSVLVADSLLAKVRSSDDEVLNFNYEIIARAVDASGESTDIAELISVSSRPLHINVNLKHTYDRQALPTLAIETTDRYEGVVPRKVHIQLFALANAAPDQQPAQTLVLDTLIQTSAGTKFSLPGAKIYEGKYKLVLSSSEGGHVIGRFSSEFNVFDSKSTSIPEVDVNYIASQVVKPGEVITWYSSGKTTNFSIYQVVYLQAGKNPQVRNIYQTRSEQPGLRTWTYKIPDDHQGPMLIKRISVLDNKINFHEQLLTITAPKPAGEAEIVLERYRKILEPGTKETVTLSLKTKDEHAAAEMMTTIYDATLDKLSSHRWHLPYTSNILYYPQAIWNYRLTDQQEVGDAAASQTRILLPTDREKVTWELLRFQKSLAGDNPPLHEVLTTDRVGYDGNRFETGGIKVRGTSTLIDTTTTDIQPAPEQPMIRIRKDFSETAFFQPQIHADQDGYFRFSYTIPETVTEWNWKMFAHTRKATFVYKEQKLQTRLNLMVQANMPRIIYQGDKLMLKSKISNLDSLATAGSVRIKIEDVLTGEDLTKQITPEQTRSFDLGANHSVAVSHLIKIPITQMNPIRVIVTAVSGSLADAEEHILPVLSTRMLLRQSQQLQFSGQQSLAIPPPRLPAGSSLQGLSLSIDQKPSAALLYALPFLANSVHDAAEQVFNKLRAQVIAMSLLKGDSSLRTAVNAARALENDGPDTSMRIHEGAATEMSPWLLFPQYAARQQKQLLNLLDENLAKENISKQLEKLYKLQQSDGGLSWFEGGRSNAHTSAYVLAGLAQIKSAVDVDLDDKLSSFVGNLTDYHKQKLHADGENRAVNLFQLYAMSYWLKAYPLSSVERIAVDQLLNNSWTGASKLSLDQQALLIINTFRFSAPESKQYENAYQQLEHLRQQAIEDPQYGMSWKAIADMEDMDRSAEETLALLSEAFALSGRYKEIQSGMLKWLNTTKQAEHWQTSTGTAAAIELMQTEKTGLSADVKRITAEVADRQLSVSDELLTGKTQDYITLRTPPVSVLLKTDKPEGNGQLTWHYFAEPVELESLNKQLKIEKAFYVQQVNKNWTPVVPGSKLKAGDRIQVRLKIETSKSLRFVHIKDPRAAAFEPKDVLSGYKYQDRMSYHQSTSDAGLDIFAEALPRGITVFTYEMVVAQSGTFSSGPASVQCVYRPAVVAYSGTDTILASD